jgi:hypothetical protein
MNQGILQSIVRLFAIFSTLDEDRKRSRELVYSFLLQQLNENTAQTYLSEYDQFISAQENPEESIQRKKKTSAYSVKVLTICERMNAELSQKQKIIVLARLMEIIYDGNVTETETDFIETVTSSFNIPDEEYLILRRIFPKAVSFSSDIPAQPLKNMQQGFMNCRVYRVISLWLFYPLVSYIYSLTGEKQSFPLMGNLYSLTGCIS